MKFVDINGKEFSCDNTFNSVEYVDFPFSNLILRKDLDSLSIDNNEVISLSNAIQIKININKIGSVLFFFRSNGFEKDKFIESVSELKKMDTNNVEDATNKVKALYKIASQHSPLFSLYCPRGELVLLSDCFESIINDVISFYVNNIPYDEVDNYIEKPRPFFRAKTSKKVSKEPAETKEKEKFRFLNPFPIISENKYHYLFCFVASFLIGFTLAISIYDMYLGNLIYIFFLVCSFAGMALNYFIYRDTLNDYGFCMSMELLINFFFSLLGIGLSIGGYFLFDNLSTEKPTTNPSILLIVGVMIAAVILSASIAFLIKFIKKTTKKKRA